MIDCYFRIYYKLLQQMNELHSLTSQTNYIDEAQLIISQYSKIQYVESQPELDFINRWMDETTALPLMIVGGAESGKKSLIYELIRQNRQLHKDWVCIYHFSSVASNYSHILYKIMIELRNVFKIEQKVDINEQKLRRYFKYWLNMISDHIEKEYLGYGRNEIPKTVIIIQGVDQFQDLKGNNVQPQFWLPSQIPKNIKLILSAKSLKEEERKHFTILQHHISHDKFNKILQTFHPKIQALFPNKQPLTLYEYHIINQMLVHAPKLSLQSKSFPSIFTEYVINISNNSLTTDEIKSLLYILTLTRKGLKSRWIEKIVNITKQKWQDFIKFFSFYVLQIEDYYIICHGKTKKLIRELVDPHYEKVKTYRYSIAKFIKNEAVSLRQLEEIIHHLILNQSYNQLKEVISRIENFVLLYTPLSKNILCQCWVKLEQLEQYDPVFQYNRAIQTFKSHYYPKEEDLYKLIFQICMFFKEYAQFQNARTPNFRHPLIKGEIDQLLEIGIYEELKNLAMIGKIKIYKHKPMQKACGQKRLMADCQKPGQTVVKLRSSGLILKEEVKIQTGMPTKRQKEEDNKIDGNVSSQSGTVSEIRLEQTEQAQHNSMVNVEEINVSIQANQQKFRNFFILSIKEYLEAYFQPHKKSSKQKSFSFESDSSDNEEQSHKDKHQKQVRFDVQKYKKTLLLKTYKDYLQDNYHQSGQQLQYYYYKQWIWLQFPWICQSIRYIYSDMINQCHPGTIHFMSPLHECHLIRQVIKITKNAKQSKLNIFAQKNIEILPIKSFKISKELRRNEISEKTYEYNRRGNGSRIFEQSKSPKLNLTNVDDEIRRQKQQGSKFGRQKRGDNNLSGYVFVTESFNKEQSTFLPKIQQKLKDSFSILRTQKQNLHDCRDYTKMIRRYNELKHENDMLTQKIEEFKKLQNSRKDKGKEEQSKVMQVINDLTTRKVSIQNQLKSQLDLQKKLEVIIKICDINKMYGSQSQHLSIYLSNIKHMISLEQKGIQDIKERLHDLVEHAKVYIKELKNRKKQLKAQSSLVHSKCVAVPLEQIEEELESMQNIVKGKSRKEKTLTRSIYKQPPNFHILEQTLGIVYKSKKDEQKLQVFLDKILKKKQLCIKNGQLKQQYQQKLKSLQRHGAQIKTLKQGWANERSLMVSSELIERKRQFEQMKKRNVLLMHAIQTLQSNESTLSS